MAPARIFLSITAPGRLVTIAILAGLVAACHMGKIPGALPHLGKFFHLSLSQAGLIVSSFSLLAAAFGMGLGIITARIGTYFAGILGLTLVAIGSALGATSLSFSLLLGSRLLEGLGFVLVAITMPGIISHVCPPGYRAIAMGIWGAFIPAAMSLMLLISPSVISHYHWQGLWWLLAGFSLTWAVLFTITFRAVNLPAANASRAGKNIRQLCTGDPIWLVGAFICYSAMFASVTAFLPTYWIDQYQISLGHASRMTSVAVAGNIGGNIMAGVLVHRGFTLRQILVTALVVGGTCAVAVFSGWLIFPFQFYAAAGFAFFSGMLPGAVFASLSSVVPVQTSIPLLVGMVFQGAGIGQVLGPIGLSAMVDYAGDWIYASIFIAVLALLGIVCGSQLLTTNRK